VTVAAEPAAAPGSLSLAAGSLALAAAEREPMEERVAV
jgi:hypothetical protein